MQVACQRFNVHANVSMCACRLPLMTNRLVGVGEGSHRKKEKGAGTLSWVRS